MANTEQKDPQQAAIENLVGQFLKARTADQFNRAAAGPHLDQDTLVAFTEGSVSERQAKPIVSHLVDCSFCRHVTAELVKLEMAFSETPVNAVTSETAEPRKVSEVLSGLLSRIFGTTDGAVFAHEEKDEGESESKPADTDTEDTK